MDFSYLIALIVGLFLWRERLQGKKGKRELAATNKMCDASETFSEWRLRNMGVYIGLSPEGRALLGAYLSAYDEFLKLHPYIDGTSHRRWIVRQFYDLPPKHPKSVQPKKGSPPGSPFLI